MKEIKGLIKQYKGFLSQNEEWYPKQFKSYQLLLFPQWEAAIRGPSGTREEHFKLGISYFENGQVVASYDPRDFKRISDFLIKNSSDLHWIEEYYKNFKKNTEKLAKIAEETYFNTPKTKKEIKIMFNELLQASLNAQKFGYITEVFTITKDEYWVVSHLKNISPELSEEEINRLMQASSNSFLQQYLQDARTKGKEYVMHKWFFIKGSYLKQPALTEKNIEEDKKTELAPEPENKQNITNKLSAEARNFVKLINTFIKIHDERKANVLRLNYALVKLLKNFKEYELEFLLSCSPNEINNLLDGELVNKNNIIKRNQECTWLFTPEAYEISLDKNDFYFVKNLFAMKDDEVKGFIAYKGKVKGTARIVLSEEEFNKLKEGDILVTSMTRPEFLPVMKKAAAFVTDEGGITCHAAIVARELKKPCVIGTNNATKMLKDGDFVEVDADKGTVKVLK